MMNIVVQKIGIPHAILIRAIEPYSGMDLMEKRRNKEGLLLTNGPGKLTKAMGINQTDNGTLITEEPLYLSQTKKRNPKKINVSARVGIPNKGIWTDALLRYTVAGNPYISGKKEKLDKDFGWKLPTKDKNKRKEEF
jgi:DNA-3-methyladenine glycosylase